MIGRTIERFHVLAELGRGGMASVWKARDELLGRTVAIKVLDPDLASSPAARRRFRREGNIAASLEHPAIVPVYEAGESGDLAYIVMKLIEGETLARFITRRLVPVEASLRIATAATEALAYAHARGVIHRDVSARNIMLTDAGRVYVLDFGLSRVMGQSESSTGHFLGTVPYLPPEIFREQPADTRSDLYSLGVVFYELLTGSRPFRGDRIETVQYEILNGIFEPPSALRPELDPRLDALLARLLARDPARRPASAEALVGELRVLAGQSADASGATPGERGGTTGEAVPGITEAEGAHAHAGIAGRIRGGAARIYLAVLPTVTESSDPRGGSPGEPPEPAGARAIKALAGTVAASLADLDRLHVVGAGREPGDGESARDFARRVGANLLLRLHARLQGTAARVGFALVEPESDTQVAGGTVSGSLLEMFDLEDRFVSRLRETLRLEGRPADSGRQPRPRDPAAAERFGQALAYMRRFDHEASVDGAVTLLERLLETEGESATVHAALARAYLRKSVLAKQRVFESKAATSCEHAARLDPGAAEVMLAAADLHLVRGRHDQALAELERTLSIAPDLLDAHLLRARALKSAGQIGEAEEACRRAITLAPDDWRGYHEFGLLLFDVGRYSEALNVWRRVIQIVPDHASAHRNLGSALHHLDRDEEAVAALRRAIDIRPHAMAFSNLGAVLFYLERYEESVAALEKAVALNSSEPLAWGNLGNACLHIPGREPRMREALERAIGLLRERLDQGSGDGEDWARLSGWLVNLGRHEEAERALRAGLERSPENVHCMVEAGQTLIKLGRPTEGLIWFRRAVESGYGAQWLRRHPELKFLTGNPEFESILALPSRNRSHT